MLAVYTFAMRVFLWIAPFVKWTSPKFARWVETRGQWATDTDGFVKTKQVVWMHCASVGEFEQARPLIERLKGEGKEYQVVVTFFSSSGYEVRKDYPLADVVTYLPADLPRRMAGFFDRIQPDLAVFVKYEFWFNAMDLLHRRGIPMILISAHLTANHWTTRWPGRLLGRRLSQFDQIFAQDQSTVDRLASINIHSGVAVGDTRIDRVVQNAQGSFELHGMEAFCKDHRVVIVGSNWPSDDAVILKALKTKKDVKLVVAPHEMNSDQLKAWRKAFGEALVCLSDIAENDRWTQAKVLYIDKVGMLSKLYRFGDVAYIGGGFGKAVHNTLEAAAYGIPVVFGPNNARFLEVQKLKEIGAGIEVSSDHEFTEAIELSLASSHIREQTRLRLEAYFSQQKGATQKILEWVDARLG